MIIKINSTRNYKTTKSIQNIHNVNTYLPLKYSLTRIKFKKIIKVLDQSKYQEIEGKLIKSKSKIQILENNEYTKIINGRSSGTLFIKGKLNIL